MFGNSLLATIMYGDKGISSQGYDSMNTPDELKIFIPGEVPDGEMIDTDSFPDGDGWNDLDSDSY